MECTEVCHIFLIYTFFLTCKNCKESLQCTHKKTDGLVGGVSVFKMFTKIVLKPCFKPNIGNEIMQKYTHKDLKYT